MPDGLVRPARPLTHGFGHPAPAARWPWPVAGATIIALSLLGWAALIQVGRVLLNLLD